MNWVLLACEPLRWFGAEVVLRMGWAVPVGCAAGVVWYFGQRMRGED